MKFLRFLDKENNLKTGYLDKNTVYELKEDILNYFNVDFNNLEKDIVNSYSINDIKIINPVSPSKIVCIGLNYKDHAKELNMELPNTPKLFIKPSTTVIGHEENIIKPKMSNEIDYEGELAIVIGKTCKDINIEESKEYIFGYTIMNDVTARDIQRMDVQWTRGKSFDTFAPIGPCIETKMDPTNQKIKTTIIKENKNNKEEKEEIKQDSNTKNMVFSPYELVSFISQVMTLNPGDVIATGTPPGVGQIKVGEKVTVEIEDIGILSNTLINL